MYKVLGFHPLRYGDIVMGQVAAKILKRKIKDCHFTLCINKNYKDIAPLFIDNPEIDQIHILDKEVDGFNDKDLNWIKYQSFDHVFNPMADHNHSDPWFLHRHQTLEVAFIHNIINQKEIDDEVWNNQIELIKWFDINKEFSNFIALQAFAGSYDSNNKKALSIQNAQELVDKITDLGYNILQLGVESEPKLDKTIRINSNYFESVKNMLGCKCLISTDSGLIWTASGYEFPTIGLYSNSYYGKEYVKNIQPKNKNAIYLDSYNVNNINIDYIISSLKRIINNEYN